MKITNIGRDVKLSFSENRRITPDVVLRFSRKFHRIVGRYFCHFMIWKNNVVLYAQIL